MFLKLIASSVLFLIFCSGCGHHWIRPQFSGNTLTSDGEAVSDVDIYWQGTSDEIEKVSTSNKDGHFLVPAKKKILFLAIGDPMIKGSFIFKKSGFKDLKLECAYGTGAVVNDNPPDIVRVSHLSDQVVMLPVH